MKRLFAFLSIVVVFTTSMLAQQSSLSKTIQHINEVTTIKADVKMTRHRAAITNDEIVVGQYYVKNSTKSQSMIFPKTKEMLIATPTAYTMVKAGKSRVAKAKGKGQNPFEVITEVLSALQTNAKITQTSMANIKTEQTSNLCTITITPRQTSAKQQNRRMMYTSVIVILNLKDKNIESIRINERGKNYTLYAFSNYRYNETIPDSMFKVSAVK